MHIEPLNGIPEKLRALAGHGSGSFRQDEREFLPSVAAGDIFTTDVSFQQGSELFQQQIARLMSEVVVEVFEMIQIDHDHSEGTLVAGSPPELQFERLFHKPAVEKPCQRVAN